MSSLKNKTEDFDEFLEDPKAWCRKRNALIEIQRNNIKRLYKELRKKKTAVICVSGGVADIVYESPGVDVRIYDFDNAEADGTSNLLDHSMQMAVSAARRRDHEV